MSGYYQGIVAPSTTNGTFPFTGNEDFAVDTNLSSGLLETTRPTLTQLATYFGGNLPWVAGRFYGLPLGATPAAVLTVTATLYAYPIYVARTTTIATLNISCTTGQTGGACHMGIYKDNGAGYPGALVYDSGAVAGLTSTVVVTNTPTVGTVVLNAGWYWIATIFTATSTFPSVAGISTAYAGAQNARLGSDTAAHALATSGEATTGISVAGTYGALPATFTSAATLTINAATPLLALGV